MAGRYTGWRKLIGGTDRPDLLDFGKKLLGYLDEQRRLGGAKSQVIQRQLPDGSIVRARFDVDIPVLEVRTRQPEVTDRSEVKPLEGFVVLPHPHQDPIPTGYNEAVVPPPKDGEGLPPWYYDTSYVPPGLDKWLPYEATRTRQPLFVDGLQYAGMVDWRNADETMSVSWHGPPSRYFFEASWKEGAKVYYKGQVLFDLATVTAAQLSLLSGVPLNLRYVFGAALRYHNGLHLLVAGMRDHTPRTEFLLAVPVRVPDNIEPLYNGQPAHTATALEADYDNIRLLWSEAVSTHRQINDARYAHPWFFNQSATVAKRIFRSVTAGDLLACLVEDTLDCSNLDDETDISRTQVFTPTYRYTETLSHTGAVINNGHGDWTSLGPPGPPASEMHHEMDIIDGVTYFGTTTWRVITSGEGEVTWISEPVAVAVDFRDDEPVYAYWQQHEDLHVTSVSTTSPSGFPVPSYVYVYYHGALDWQTRDAYTTDFEYAISHTSTSLAGRLILPDETIEAFYTSRSINNTLVADYDHEIVETWTPTSDTRVANELQHHALTVNDTRASGVLAPLFLDLRSGLAVTQKVVFGDVYLGSFATTLVNGAPTHTPGITRTRTYQVDSRISLAGEELHATTASASAAAGTVTPSFTLNGGFYRYYGGYGEGGTQSFPTGLKNLTFITALGYSWGPVFLASPAVPITLDDAAPAVVPHGFAVPDEEIQPAPINSSLQVPSAASALSLPAPAPSINMGWLSETPYRVEATQRSFGGWDTFKGSYAVSMPWPTGVATVPAYLHVVDGLPLSDLTGQDEGLTGYAPIWVLTATYYRL